MNKVAISGTLTKAPYVSAKGWLAATLAVAKEGTDYKMWVNLYIPKDSARAFAGAQANEAFTVTGELDEGKDKEGNKRLQVKVLKAERAAPHGVSRTSHVTPQYADQGVTDLDIPF